MGHGSRRKKSGGVLPPSHRGKKTPTEPPLVDVEKLLAELEKPPEAAAASISSEKRRRRRPPKEPEKLAPSGVNYEGKIDLGLVVSPVSELQLSEIVALDAIFPNSVRIKAVLNDQLQRSLTALGFDFKDDIEAYLSTFFNNRNSRPPLWLGDIKPLTNSAITFNVLLSTETGAVDPLQGGSRSEDEESLWILKQLAPSHAQLADLEIRLPLTYPEDPPSVGVRFSFRVSEALLQDINSKAAALIAENRQTELASLLCLLVFDDVLLLRRQSSADSGLWEQMRQREADAVRAAALKTTTPPWKLEPESAATSLHGSSSIDSDSSVGFGSLSALDELSSDESLTDLTKAADEDYSDFASSESVSTDSSSDESRPLSASESEAIVSRRKKAFRLLDHEIYINVQRGAGAQNENHYVSRRRRRKNREPSRSSEALGGAARASVSAEANEVIEKFSRPLKAQPSLKEVKAGGRELRRAGDLSRYETDFEHLEVLGTSQFDVQVLKAKHKIDRTVYAIQCIPLFQCSFFQESLFGRFFESQLTQFSTTLCHEIFFEALRFSRLQHPSIGRVFQTWTEPRASLPLVTVSEFQTTGGKIELALLNSPPTNTPMSTPVQASARSVFVQREFVNGRSLRDLLKENGIGSRKAWQVWREVLEAVSAIHSEKMAHRCLNPESIVMEAPSSVKVLSSGLEMLSQRESFLFLKQLWTESKNNKFENHSLKDSSNFFDQWAKLILEECGGYMDSTSFLSHEEFSLLRDQKNDIFCLGLLLLELLREPPFKNEKQRLESFSLIRCGLDSLSLELKAGISSAPIRLLLSRLLDPDPTKRPAASDLLANEPLIPSPFKKNALDSLLKRIASGASEAVQLQTLLLSRKFDAAQAGPFIYARSSARKTQLKKLLQKFASNLSVSDGSSTAVDSTANILAALTDWNGVLQRDAHAWSIARTAIKASVENMFFAMGVEPLEIPHFAFDIDASCPEPPLLMDTTRALLGLRSSMLEGLAATFAFWDARAVAKTPPVVGRAGVWAGSGSLTAATTRHFAIGLVWTRQASLPLAEKESSLSSGTGAGQEAVFAHPQGAPHAAFSGCVRVDVALRDFLVDRKAIATNLWLFEAEHILTTVQIAAELIPASIRLTLVWTHVDILPCVLSSICEIRSEKRLRALDAVIRAIGDPLQWDALELIFLLFLTPDPFLAGINYAQRAAETFRADDSFRRLSPSESQYFLRCARRAAALTALLVRLSSREWNKLFPDEAVSCFEAAEVFAKEEKDLPATSLDQTLQRLWAAAKVSMLSSNPSSVKASQSPLNQISQILALVEDVFFIADNVTSRFLLNLPIDPLFSQTTDSLAFSLFTQTRQPLCLATGGSISQLIATFTSSWIASASQPPFLPDSPQTPAPLEDIPKKLDPIKLIANALSVHESGESLSASLSFLTKQTVVCPKFSTFGSEIDLQAIAALYIARDYASQSKEGASFHGLALFAASRVNPHVIIAVQKRRHQSVALTLEEEIWKTAELRCQIRVGFVQNLSAFRNSLKTAGQAVCFVLLQESKAPNEIGKERPSRRRGTSSAGDWLTGVDPDELNVSEDVESADVPEKLIFRIAFLGSETQERFGHKMSKPFLQTESTTEAAMLIKNMWQRYSRQTKNR